MAESNVTSFDNHAAKLQADLSRAIGLENAIISIPGVTKAEHLEKIIAIYTGTVTLLTNYSYDGDDRRDLSGKVTLKTVCHAVDSIISGTEDDHIFIEEVIVSRSLSGRVIIEVLMGS